MALRFYVKVPSIRVPMRPCSAPPMVRVNVTGATIEAIEPAGFTADIGQRRVNFSDPGDRCAWSGSGRHGPGRLPGLPGRRKAPGPACSKRFPESARLGLIGDADATPDRALLVSMIGRTRRGRLEPMPAMPNAWPNLRYGPVRGLIGCASGRGRPCIERLVYDA